ncbi:MAG: hypothetical protein CMF62_00010 [Magnetococcales bacterium]|nr:hypothetical protein [Magnetococcales bacterium]|tara:strand:+ start:2539 stop:3489 length:951 start_codon:yes stop_codon:yes gene_type:complete
MDSSRIILEYNNFLSDDDGNSQESFSEGEPETPIYDVDNMDENTDSVEKPVTIDEVPIKAHPDVIFIVPFRDRENHLFCFNKIMRELLEKKKNNYTYEVIVSEQDDTREFNRGAIKNLGFLYAKYKYPNFYKDITFVFNDVDNMPGAENIVENYILDENTHVKHHYGFKFALGGVFSIKGWLFEKVNGFPNYWGWGFEDNCIQERIKKFNIEIDRNDFATIDNKNWLMFYHGYTRKLDNQVVNKFLADNPEQNGLRTIKYSENSFLKEEFDDFMYKVKIHNWDIPEKEKKVIFEQRKNPSKVFQNKVQMGNIMRFR